MSRKIVIARPLDVNFSASTPNTSRICVIILISAAMMGSSCFPMVASSSVRATFIFADPEAVAAAVPP